MTMNNHLVQNIKIQKMRTEGYRKQNLPRIMDEDDEEEEEEVEQNKTPLKSMTLIMNIEAAMQ